MRAAWILLLPLNNKPSKRTSLLPPTNEVCKGYVFTGVCLSTPGGACMVGGHAWLLLGGMCVCSGGVYVVVLGGACVVALGGHAWLLRGGTCMVALGRGGHGCSRGGMHGCSGGVCVVFWGGHAWFLVGACMVFWGGMCVFFRGSGHA